MGVIQCFVNRGTETPDTNLRQALCLLAGLAVSALLIYVYVNDAVPQPFFGMKMPTVPGLQVVMLLNCALGFSSGFGGGAFAWASSELTTIAQDIDTCIHDATWQEVEGVEGAAATVKKDLDKLFEICPPAIEQMLGASVSQAKGHIATAKTEAGLTVEALRDLPGLLQDAASETSEMSGWQLVLQWNCWLPLLAGLSLSAVLVCGGAAGAPDYPVGLYFLAAQNATVNKHLTKKLSSRAFLDLMAGETSSSYGLAEYYLTGEVDNPAVEHLQRAQQAVSASVSWLDENALVQTCPMWEAQRVYGDLTALHASLNVSEESVLKPSNLYGHYKEAVHAGLAITQMILGAICLPFLTVTASWVLDYLSRGGAYQKLDKEGQSSDDEAASKEGELNALYYVVYAFSALIFAVGAWMYFVPQPGLVRPITGTLLFGSGVFLMMNSDLIVTYFRLHEQVEKFRKNNEGYQKNLEKEAQEVRDLRRAQKGFEEIDRKFGKDVERAMKEIKVMQTTARSQVGMTIGRMVKIYLDADGDKRIADAELEEAVATMADIFGAMIKGLRTERLPKMLEAIRGHRSFRKEKTITLDAFSKAFEITLFVPDVKQVAQSVKTVLDDAEIKAAARASKRGRASPKASPKASP
ncbi:unnamed protein product [Symbiodinium natans]|uniref:EF-hand domain-containing protein n=1 Tax=Symbiodinium natans TaxID=878477 RepID=A0A812VCM1_9DINO|nr:unnamed protein product [Symbiodinium natans]